jgi:hypothetical protein
MIDKPLEEQYKDETGLVAYYGSKPYCHWLESRDAKREELLADKDKLIIKYQEYVKLFNDELNEIIGLATAHGWKSSRYEQGKELWWEIETILSRIQEKDK